MPATKHLKLLSVRLPDSEARELKSLAARRGMSLQEAVHQAIVGWTSQVPGVPSEDVKDLEGSLKGSSDVLDLMRREKEAELTADQRWA